MKAKSQAFRNPTRGRYNKNVGVTIVLAMKAMVLPSGEKRVGFDPLANSYSPWIRTIFIGYPKIFGIGKGNKIFADGGLPKQSCICYRFALIQ